MTNTSVFKKDEAAIFALRSLYEKYGYTQYKMNKFEEYDLYLRNKDFLVSDHVITFTDTNGKLMALKPDVTLSIVKNGEDGETEKLYYNENVYRVSKDSNSFREIMQVGLECVGHIDAYSVYEVVLLAARSLAEISSEYLLDISHMGVISEVLDSVTSDEGERRRLLEAIGQKNAHDISSVPHVERIRALIQSYGSASDVRPVLLSLYDGQLSPAAEELLSTVSALEDAGLAGKIRIDFSVLNDCSYYNGIAFKGFIEGIPASILSGGQYDPLLRKLGRNARAIGFAVYLDQLALLRSESDGYTVDTLLLYEKGCPVAAVNRAIEVFSSRGKRVMALPQLPTKIRYRELVRLDGKGAFTIEENA